MRPPIQDFLSIEKTKGRGLFLTLFRKQFEELFDFADSETLPRHPIIQEQNQERIDPLANYRLNRRRRVQRFDSADFFIEKTVFTDGQRRLPEVNHWTCAKPALDRNDDPIETAQSLIQDRLSRKTRSTRFDSADYFLETHSSCYDTGIQDTSSMDYSFDGTSQEVASRVALSGTNFHPINSEYAVRAIIKDHAQLQRWDSGDYFLGMTSNIKHDSPDNISITVSSNSIPMEEEGHHMSGLSDDESFESRSHASSACPTSPLGERQQIRIRRLDGECDENISMDRLPHLGRKMTANFYARGIPRHQRWDSVDHSSATPKLGLKDGISISIEDNGLRQSNSAPTLEAVSGAQSSATQTKGNLREHTLAQRQAKAKRFGL